MEVAAWSKQWFLLIDKILTHSNSVSSWLLLIGQQVYDHGSIVSKIYNFKKYFCFLMPKSLVLWCHSIPDNVAKPGNDWYCNHWCCHNFWMVIETTTTLPKKQGNGENECKSSCFITVVYHDQSWCHIVVYKPHHDCNDMQLTLLLLLLLTGRKQFIGSPICSQNMIEFDNQPDHVIDNIMETLVVCVALLCGWGYHHSLKIK